MNTPLLHDAPVYVIAQDDDPEVPWATAPNQMIEPTSDHPEPANSEEPANPAIAKSA